MGRSLRKKEEKEKRKVWGGIHDSGRSKERQRELGVPFRGMDRGGNKIGRLDSESSRHRRRGKVKRRPESNVWREINQHWGVGPKELWPKARGRGSKKAMTDLQGKTINFNRIERKELER